MQGYHRAIVIAVFSLIAAGCSESAGTEPTASSKTRASSTASNEASSEPRASSEASSEPQASSDDDLGQGAPSYSATDLAAGAVATELSVTDRTISVADVDASSAGVLWGYEGGTAIWVLDNGELARFEVDCRYVSAVAFADDKVAYSCSGTNVVIVADDGTTAEIGGIDGDQDGAGRAARLHDVAGLAFGTDGMLYVAERNKLRAVDESNVAFTVYEERVDREEFRALKDVAADPNSTALLISDRFAVLGADPERSLRPSVWRGNQDEYPVYDAFRHADLLYETRGLAVTASGEVFVVSQDTGDLIAFIPHEAPDKSGQSSSLFTGAESFDVARVGLAGIFGRAYDVAVAPEGLLVAGDSLWLVTPGPSDTVVKGPDDTVTDDTAAP